MHLLMLTATILLFSTGTPVVSHDIQAGMGGKPEADDALDGLDPVLLVGGKEVPGKSGLSVTRGDFVYLFSTPETKATFERDPARYEIQFGGVCATMGKTAGGNPSDFIVHEGKIYIFGSDDCHKKFQADPAKYLPPPAAPLPSSADRRGRGPEAHRARCHGDGWRRQRRRADELRRVLLTQVQNRPRAKPTITTKTMWSFPDRVRQERTDGAARKDDDVGDGADPSRACGSWAVRVRSYPMRAGQPPSLEQDFGRHPVALLARHGSPAGVQGCRRIGKAPSTASPSRHRSASSAAQIDVTLALETSGRIHSATYQRPQHRRRVRHVPCRLLRFPSRSAGCSCRSARRRRSTDSRPRAQSATSTSISTQHAARSLALRTQAQVGR